MTRYSGKLYFIANLNPFKGPEQGGARLVLVIQNNTGKKEKGTADTLFSATISRTIS